MKKILASGLLCGVLILGGCTVMQQVDATIGSTPVAAADTPKSPNANRIMLSESTEEVTLQPEMTATQLLPGTETPSPSLEAEKLITPTFPPVVASNDGRNLYMLFKEIPLAELKTLPEYGFEQINSISYGNDLWLITAMNNPGLIQDVNIYKTVDSETFNRLLEKGNKIDCMAWGNNTWLVASTQITGTADQKIILSSEVPLEEIAIAAEQGFWVTDIDYGEKKWVTVFTKSDEIMDQRVELIKELGPKKEYIENDDEYLLTSTAYGDQQWVVVRTVLSDFSTQLIFIDDVFQGYVFHWVAWYDQFDNTRVFFANGEWIYVMAR